MARKAITECVTYVLTTFLKSSEQTDSNMESVCLNTKETSYYSFFLSKSFNIIQKPAFTHFGEHKKAIWCNLFSIQNEEISLNCNWCRKLNPTVKQNWTAKSTKCWKNQVSFCHQSLVSEKSLAVTWNIAGVKRIWSENL